MVEFMYERSTETLASLDLNWMIDFSLTHVWTVHKGSSRLGYCELGGTVLN